MRKILLQKLTFAFLSLILVLTLTFILMQLIPGDPFVGEQSLPPEIYKSLRDHYGLNEPFYVQYFKYIKQLFTFDFGLSLIYKGRSVTDIIRMGIGPSALLALEALLVAVPAGLLLGIFAALKKNKFQDRLILFLAIIGISLPSFILATLLQYVLGIKLHLLPIARWGSFSQSIMPCLSLAALPMAFIARMTRTKLIDELKKGYVTTARAKGLPESKIIYSHVLRNILPPILSYLGPLIASVATGSFIIERIFAVPGLGFWFVTSVLNRDYPLIMGITVFYCILILLATFTVDMICLWLDPRLSHAKENKRTIA